MRTGPHSEATRAKLSALQKARWASGVYDFHRGRDRDGENTGSHSEERRAAMSATTKRMWREGRFKGGPNKTFVKVNWAEAQRIYDEEGLSFRALAKRIGIDKNTVGNAAKDGRFVGRTRRAAMKVHCKKRNIKAEWTPELRARQSRRRKAYLEAHPESHPNRILANMRPKMSYPERRVFDWLASVGVQFKHNARVGRYWVDFLIGSVAVEIDGEYWHNAERDELRDAEIAKAGIVVVRIPANQVNKHGPRVVLEYIGALPSGTAPALGAGDRRFDSVRPDQIKL
jgi:very-short-patch-repair endonuclease/predicted DNA-binding protein (UPF0251 family)